MLTFLRERHSESCEAETPPAVLACLCQDYPTLNWYYVMLILFVQSPLTSLVFV